MSLHEGRSQARRRTGGAKTFGGCATRPGATAPLLTFATRSRFLLVQVHELDDVANGDGLPITDYGNATIVRGPVCGNDGARLAEDDRPGIVHIDAGRVRQPNAK